MTLICLIYQKGKQLINSPRTKIKKNINLNYKKQTNPRIICILNMSGAALLVVL